MTEIVSAHTMDDDGVEPGAYFEGSFSYDGFARPKLTAVEAPITEPTSAEINHERLLVRIAELAHSMSSDELEALIAEGEELVAEKMEDDEENDG